MEDSHTLLFTAYHCSNDKWPSYLVTGWPYLLVCHRLITKEIITHSSLVKIHLYRMSSSKRNGSIVSHAQSMNDYHYVFPYVLLLLMWLVLLLWFVVIFCNICYWHFYKFSSTWVTWRTSRQRFQIWSCYLSRCDYTIMNQNMNRYHYLALSLSNS